MWLLFKFLQTFSYVCTQKETILTSAELIYWEHWQFKMMHGWTPPPPPPRTSSYVQYLLCFSDLFEISEDFVVVYLTKHKKKYINQRHSTVNEPLLNQMFPSCLLLVLLPLISCSQTLWKFWCHPGSECLWTDPETCHLWSCCLLPVWLVVLLQNLKGTITFGISQSTFFLLGG